jgi:hypothetical protein
MVREVVCGNRSYGCHRSTALPTVLVYGQSIEHGAQGSNEPTEKSALPVGRKPNAGPEPLPEAGATQERTLEAVRCSALLGSYLCYWYETAQAH